MISLPALALLYETKVSLFHVTVFEAFEVEKVCLDIYYLNTLVCRTPWY